jgi:hypothetical protein
VHYHPLIVSQNLTYRIPLGKLEHQVTKAKSSAPQTSIRAMRKPFWFERFLWFLTSEGVLVLAGRDVGFLKFLKNISPVLCDVLNSKNYVLGFHGMVCVVICVCAKLRS